MSRPSRLNRPRNQNLPLERRGGIREFPTYSSARLPSLTPRSRAGYPQMGGSKMSVVIVCSSLRDVWALAKEPLGTTAQIHSAEPLMAIVNGGDTRGQHPWPFSVADSPSYGWQANI
jgi:hypothetical protein